MNSYSYPFKEWWYSSLPGIGSNIRLEFVDTTLTGDYQLGRDRNIFEFLKGQKFGTRLDEEEPQQFSGFSNLSYEVLRMYTRLGEPDRSVRFPELQEIVHPQLSYDSLPFEVAFRMQPYTERTGYVPITVFVPTESLEFRELPAGSRAVVDVFLQVNDAQGHTLEVAEDTLEMIEQKGVPPEKRSSCGVYLKGLFLEPGRYQVRVAVKDEYSGRIGVRELAFAIPASRERPALSSLIVADYIQPVKSQRDASDRLVMNGFKVIPSADRRFHKSEKLGLFFEIYGVGLDLKREKPDVELTLHFVIGDTHVILALSACQKRIP